MEREITLVELLNQENSIDKIRAKAARGEELTISEQIGLLDSANGSDPVEILYMVALLQYQRFPVSDRLNEIQQQVANKLGDRYRDALGVAQERAQQTRKVLMY